MNDQLPLLSSRQRPSAGIRAGVWLRQVTHESPKIARSLRSSYSMAVG